MELDGIPSIDGVGHLLPGVPDGEDVMPNGSPAGGSGSETPPPTPRKPSGKKGNDALVLALATGLSVPQAAKRAKIGMTSAYRRLEDPAVRAAVKKARGDILGQAIAKLVNASCQAVDALTENLNSDDPNVKLKAAAAILQNMIQGVQLTEIVHRLEALERRT
jgi:hypothetical protein